MKPVVDLGQGVVANTRLTAQGCFDLPAFYFDGHYVSGWQLTWGERLRVLCSGMLYLWVLGHRHPPVTLTTQIATESTQSPGRWSRRRFFRHRHKTEQFLPPQD